MQNIINMAKKEFADLMSSWLVLVMIVVYAVLVVHMAYQFYDILANHFIEEAIVINFLCGVIIILTNYGSLLAVVVGFSSIASERHGNALNTLIVKPLYRDTIVNGKMLGACAFLLCLFCLTLVIYTSGLFIVCGGVFASVFLEYLDGLPFVVGISLLYVMIFFSLSVLISILFKNQAFALAFGVLATFISETISHIGVTQGLSQLTGYNINTIAEWTPDGILSHITFMLYRWHPGLVASSSDVTGEVVKLALYMFIMVFLCYIVFLRRDIT